MKLFLVHIVTAMSERITADGYNGLARTECKLNPKTSNISAHDLH